MDASTRSTGANAYVTGLGASKRIVVWDTTLRIESPNEILFTYGHEQGPLCAAPRLRRVWDIRRWGFLSSLLDCVLPDALGGADAGSAVGDRWGRKLVFTGIISAGGAGAELFGIADCEWDQPQYRTSGGCLRAGSDSWGSFRMRRRRR